MIPAVPITAVATACRYNPKYGDKGNLAVRSLAEIDNMVDKKGRMSTVHLTTGFPEKGMEMTFFQRATAAFNVQLPHTAIHTRTRARKHTHTVVIIVFTT